MVPWVVVVVYLCVQSVSPTCFAGVQLEKVPQIQTNNSCSQRRHSMERFVCGMLLMAAVSVCLIVIVIPCIRLPFLLREITWRVDHWLGSCTFGTWKRVNTFEITREGVIFSKWHGTRRKHGWQPAFRRIPFRLLISNLLRDDVLDVRVSSFEGRSHVPPSKQR